ncbi:FAD-dependent monooxygenase [Streptomyces sp. H10-C2]|uniref:FAD-dependent monooxygenase n=1 Tax=unclassified Streptomyces TaxID=2593676 RepID=UPI0024BA9209|nr:MULTISPECIES: FAD-dependent monooxygenase [unclassified Streptomyces]MDJ0346937.1 FAD-dependent monooxygenase [Streptomyces sp. PH10-H1]MDJ0370460.1 FAD-dependent monooxygenase [Streptomyces sp. H10-C2]
MSDDRVPVLIVGGSLVGLSAALFLAGEKIPCLLVERHPGTSVHPRAVGYYPRTLEILRSAGVEETVLQTAAGFKDHTLRAGMESLTGKVFWSRDELAGGDELEDLTPSRMVLLPQDRLEPLLRSRAELLGARTSYGTELVSFEADESGVTSVLLDRASGTERTVRSDYLVAADGPRSLVRETLGVPRHGRGVISHQLSVAFTAHMREALDGRRFSVAHIQNDEVTGILVHDDTLTEGTLVVAYDPDDGDSLDDFTDERCVHLVRAAVGTPDLEVRIRSRFPWEMAEFASEEYRRGRIFLAGDAAHVIPPTGGYGSNTGIADAHNLAWKLASVIRGTAGAGLLDSYDAERRPLGDFVANQGALELAVRSNTATDEQRAQIAEPLAVTMGYRYVSEAAPAGAGEEAAVPPSVTDPRSTGGRPGTRAPHLLVESQGKEISTLDLFGGGFTLLAGESADPWCAAAGSAAQELGIRLSVHQIGGSAGQALRPVTGDFAQAYGVGPQGAVLVRPDGFVAWRSDGADPDPAAGLGSVLRRLLARVS